MSEQTKSMETIPVGVEIREAMPEDAEALARLYQESWLETYPNPESGITDDDIKNKIKDWTSPESIKAWRQRLSATSENTHQYVATVEGNVIGHTRLHKKEDGPNKMQTFYVSSKFHGTGIAQKLAKQALNWLGSEKDIALEVAKYNVRAIRFYEKLGFTIVGDTESPAAALPSGKVIPEYQMILRAQTSNE